MLDQISRVPGVGSTQQFGAEYAMNTSRSTPTAAGLPPVRPAEDAARPSSQNACSSPRGAIGADPAPEGNGVHRDGLGRGPLHLAGRVREHHPAHRRQRRHRAPEGRRPGGLRRSNYGFDTQYNGKPIGAFAIQCCPCQRAERGRGACAARWTNCAELSQRRSPGSGPMTPLRS